jgi:hypothetical protein
MPGELEGPGSSPTGNLAILMLANSAVGNDIVEMLGLYLAADARLNVWYAEGAGKIKPSGSELAEIRVLSSNLIRRVFDAWKVFEAESIHGGPVSESVYRSALEALGSAVSDICSRMGITLAELGRNDK